MAVTGDGNGGGEAAFYRGGDAARNAGARGLRPFVFLDKDGTLVEDVPYNVELSRVRLVPGAAEALRRLQRAGFGLAVVSNQSGVARGYFGEAEVRAVGRHLVDGLDALGVRISGFYYCPHHPAGRVADYALACDCRKPAPGLIRRAALELGADIATSWLVGDILDDVEAGRRAGCRTILLDVGHESEWTLSPERRPTAVAAGLPAAAELIVEAASKATRPSNDTGRHDERRDARPAAAMVGPRGRA